MRLTGRRPPVLLATLLVLGLVASGCATRRSSSEIAQAAGAGQQVVGPDGASVAVGTGADAQGRTGAAARAGGTGGTTGAGGSQVGSGGGSRAGTSATGPGPALGNGSGSADGGTRTAAGSPVRIGVVGTMSGVGGTQRASVAAVQAWARAANARGGVAGHPVEVLVVDDGNDPARLRSSVQQLVEQRGVIAFVALLGAFTLNQGTVDYLQSKGVPVVGGDRLGLQWQRSPMFFPQGPAGDALIWLHMVNTARLAGKGAPIGWLSCQEAQICKDADRLWQPDAAQLGLDVRYRAQVSVAQPSFTSECLRAQQAGVKWFLLATDANSIRRIAASCEQQGYHPRYAVLQTSQEMTQLPALEGGYYASSTFPWVSRDSLARKEFQDAMARYAPDTELSSHASSGWTAAKLFEQATRSLSAHPTAKEVLDGLYALHAESLGGLTSPLTFSRGKPAPPQYCYFAMELRSARWATTPGAATCRAPT